MLYKIKKLLRDSAMKISHLFSTLCLSSIPFCAFSQDQIAQTLNISTHFTSIVDKPSWLLELRDMESGLVLPYLFDIRNNDNFFFAFSKEHSYRVVASVLKFGPYATIKNFCKLESGVITGKSMLISITGVLSPDPRKTFCRVNKFSQRIFTIVPYQEPAQSYNQALPSAASDATNATAPTTTTTPTQPPTPPQQDGQKSATPSATGKVVEVRTV